MNPRPCGPESDSGALDHSAKQPFFLFILNYKCWDEYFDKLYLKKRLLIQKGKSKNNKLMNINNIYYYYSSRIAEKVKKSEFLELGPVCFIRM